VTNNKKKEEELDRLLIVLSKPLTGLILSVLLGIDPRGTQSNLSEKKTTSP
jgi:hypothetical protein